MSRPLPSRTAGLITAAGRATRLGRLPCSKELLPVGFMADPTDGQPRPKPVSLYLIEQMRAAGATQLGVVIRPGKWDIPDYYGDGSRFGLQIGYFMMGDPWGPPFSAAQALPFLRDATVLFGFSDILLHPPDALAHTVKRLELSEADIVVGVCPMDNSGALDDVVEWEPGGRVIRLEPKEMNPRRGPRDWTWSFAAWRPTFSEFMLAEVSRLAEQARRIPADAPPPEWPFGTVIAAALGAGLHVDSVGADDWRMLDTGTPARLAAATGFPGVWSGR